MAVTTTVTKQGAAGDLLYGVVKVTPDTDNYPSGGEAIAFKTVLDWNDSITPHVVSVQMDAAGGYVPQWDDTNAKILLFEAGADGAALDQVTTGDMSANDMTFFVLGFSV